MKKLIAGMFVGALLLAGCGEEKKTPPTPPPTGTPTTPPATPPVTPPPSTPK